MTNYRILQKVKELNYKAHTIQYKKDHRVYIYIYIIYIYIRYIYIRTLLLQILCICEPIFVTQTIKTQANHSEYRPKKD